MFILDALIQKTLLEVLWILSILRLCGGGVSRVLKPGDLKK